METRRLILFFIFTFSLVMLWDAWQKQQARLAAPAAGAPATQQPAKSAGIPQPTISLPTPAVPALPGVPAVSVPVPLGTASPGVVTKVVVKTDTLTAEIVSEGGDLRYVEFPQQKDTIDKARNFVLLGQHNYFAQTGLLAQGVELPTHKTNFSLAGGTYEMKPGEDKLAVRMEAVQNGIKVSKIYTFSRGSYALDVSYEISNGSAAAIAPSAYLQFVRDARRLKPYL